MMRWAGGRSQLGNLFGTSAGAIPTCGVRCQSKSLALTIISGSCIYHFWSRSGEQRQRQRLLLCWCWNPSHPSQKAPRCWRGAQPHFGSGSHGPAAGANRELPSQDTVSNNVMTRWQPDYFLQCIKWELHAPFGKGRLW
jgi:hypothetical protein